MQSNINFRDHQQNLVSDSSSKQIHQSKYSGKNFNQTQKPGNVANASAAAYNEAAQNYMINIVQNVYVGGPNLSHTMPGFQMGQQISRSQNTSKRQMKVSKRQNSELRQIADQVGPGVLNEESKSKRSGMNVSAKGSIRMQRGKANSGMSTNQAAINHYLNEIQSTTNETGTGQTLKKKKSKKQNQGIQRYQQAQMAELMNNQAAATMNKFIKSGSKLVLAQGNQQIQSMQKPFQALVASEPDVAWIGENGSVQEGGVVRTRTAHSMNRTNPDNLKHQLDLQISGLKNSYGMEHPYMVAAQGLSPLSQVSNPFSSPKSQAGRNDKPLSPGITHDPNMPQQTISRNPNRSFNLTPGTATFNSANATPGPNTHAKHPKDKNLQTTEYLQSRTSGKSKKMTMSGNGRTINLRQSQINFNKKPVPSTNQFMAPNADKYYNTHASVHMSMACSPTSMQGPTGQLPNQYIASNQMRAQDYQKVVKIKPQAVQYKIGQGQVPLDARGKEESQADLIMGGLDERDGGFQFVNEFRERKNLADLDQESSEREGEFSPDGQVLVQDSDRESNQIAYDINSRQHIKSPPSYRGNQVFNPILAQARGIKQVSSSRNSQASMIAMMASSNPVGIQEYARTQAAHAMGSGLMAKRTPRSGFKSPKTPGRTEFSAQSRGHKLSSKHLHNRQSVNGANLIYTSTDGGYKRTFTQGGQRNQATAGTLPKIDLVTEKTGDSDRRSSVVRPLEPEQQFYSIGVQPKLEDFHDNWRDGQPELASAQMNAQSSIQPRAQQALQAIQGKRSTKNPGIGSAYQNPLEIKSVNQARRKIKTRGPAVVSEGQVVHSGEPSTKGPAAMVDGATRTNYGSQGASITGIPPQSAQDSGYATFSGNNSGSRNKFVHQQQQYNKLSLTQTMKKPQTATRPTVQEDSDYLVVSPPPDLQKPTVSPRASFQQARIGISAQARSHQSSKLRSHTRERHHLSKRQAAEAQIKEAKIMQGITNQELDRQIDRQLELQQHNRQQSRADASELSSWGKVVTQDQAIKSTAVHSRAKRGSQFDNSDLYDQGGSAFKEKARPGTRGDVSSPPLGRNKAEIGLGATEVLPGKHNRRASKEVDVSQLTSNHNSSHNPTQIHSATHNPRQLSKASRLAGSRLATSHTAAKPGRGPANFPPPSGSKGPGGHRGSQHRRENRKANTAAAEIQEPASNPSTSLQRKDSQRKVVVKNLVIQNSNLQNCNVYIGGNDDEKQVTIVSKDEDPRETPNHNSAQHGTELSPLLPESKNKNKNEKEKPTLADFRITRLIGEGHQGKVVQATHRQTGKVYALKIIPQKLIKEQKQIQHVFNEKRMLTKLRKDYRYFPKIYSTFSDRIGPSNQMPNTPGVPQPKNLGSQVGQGGSQCLVFQMSLIDGVNLFQFQKHNLCIEVGIVKYFAAQALMIVDYLQDQNLIYRDIKPENFIVEFDSGNLKLVDFGFAKELVYEKSNGLFQGRGRTFTKCGTPEYMAPEVIQQKELNNTQTRVSQSSFLSKQLGYSLECDIWSWGVMLCEMIGGFNPFTGGNIHQTFENILTLNINWPKNISNQCKNLLQSIFVVDPNLRASIQEIKKHGFFHGFHWYDLESSISTENKEELLELLSDVKKDIEKEDLKDREEREKLSTKKRLSVQTKNLQNQPCLTEVTEEEKKNELSDPVDSDNFSQVCDDFEEITPLELLQPKSAGLPFKMKFFAPHLHNDSDSRINVSDFSMRKNQLAFKDF